MAAGGAFLSGYEALLKEFYADGGIAEQLNKETEVINLFKKGTGRWEGKRLVIPTHVSRNEGRGVVKNTKLPNIGHQGFEDFVLTSKIMSIRGSIDRELMKAAPSEGAGAFISAVDAEIEGMKDDATDLADLYAVAGGPIKGYLNEHKASNATDAGAPIALGFLGPLADVTWEYSGDFSPFKPKGSANVNDPKSADYKGVTLAIPDTWVRVQLIRQDTYAEIVPAGGVATLTGIFVVGYDEDLCTLILKNVANAAGSSFTTATVADGYAIALQLHSTQLTDGAGNNFGGVTDDQLYEPYGIFSNLSTQNHFSQDRTSATGYKVFQSTIFTQATAGAHARAALTVKRYQAVRDKARQAIGKKVASMETIFMSELQVQHYIGILTATVQYINNNGQSKADASPSDDNLAIGTRELRTARHIPRGMIIILSSKAWKLYERAPGSFINEDGSMFARVPGFNLLEMAWTWSYNVICRQPAANGILTGISLV